MSAEGKDGVRRLAGMCLCGAVHYTVDDNFAYAANCHCSLCRRATGSAYKPFAGIRRERLELVAGRESLLFWGDPAQSHDVRCRQCGSLLWSVVRDNLWVHVALGTLVDAPRRKPDHHIMVGSKAAWEEITDDLPQYDEWAG